MDDYLSEPGGGPAQVVLDEGGGRVADQLLHLGEVAVGPRGEVRLDGGVGRRGVVAHQHEDPVDRRSQRNEPHECHEAVPAGHLLHATGRPVRRAPDST